MATAGDDMTSGTAAARGVHDHVLPVQPAEPEAEVRARERRSEEGVEVIDLWQDGRRPGKQWLFRVRDGQRRSYVSKRHAKLSKAWEWADGVKAELRLGLTSSGRAPYAVVGEAYAKDLERIGRKPAYVKEVRRLVAAAVAAGATDMRAEGFRARVATWLGDAPSFVEGRETPNAKTKNRWLVILKSVAKAGVTAFGLRTNPLTGIKPFKEDKTVKTAFRVEQLRTMVADARAGHAYYRHACLLVYGGMRRDEAAHTRWQWVDLEARTITLRVLRDERGRVTWAPKGNKERILPLLDELAEILAAVPEAERVGWVVADDKYRRMDDKNGWLAFRSYLKDACGIEPGTLSPHCTRHTWTALMLATGASPNRVRRWLGHAKLETTDLYADAEAMFERIVEDWPRAQFRLRPAKAAPPARPQVTIDLDRDLVAQLLERLDGRSIDALAAAAAVPPASLKEWVVDGVPDAVRHYLAVLAAPPSRREG